MIDLKAAEQLLDFGARMGAGQRAQEQLEGAVAIHNILLQHNVAYLADEVGMGKTYVALGAMALFRHFDPQFRVMIIAPRENIQNKWEKELRNFVQHNVRFADLRVKATDGRPARPLVSCHNLLDLVHEAVLDPNRDFFTRLTSFSLPLAGGDRVDSDAARRLRAGVQQRLPWMPDEIFDLRNKQEFKDQFARAVCCALPVFDLLIVDEGHNLRHGFQERSAARNRVLALALGHPSDRPDRRLFPSYGPRARRVLFLSATPVEETYAQLWNQLDVVGRANGFEALRDRDIDDERKKVTVSQFLVRRVTAIRIGDSEYTKNLYRREWRNGGVLKHDDPIQVSDPRQRLIVALVQKKVSELLRHERFNRSFQIGMLASFESFLETAKLKRLDDEGSNFDDAGQADDEFEKEGIDVGDVNKLARAYRKRFGEEMPHPKMDAVVESLTQSWRRGDKALVFVRRVASVKELKRKLDECYDAWLLARLRRELPAAVLERFEQAVELYQGERSVQRDSETPAPADDPTDDHGGTDSFFAWFFRGEGPKGFVSGANVQQRFMQAGAVYSTFFEDNYAADLLGCRPGEVETALARVLQVDGAELRARLRDRSKAFLTRTRKVARADRFEAVQAAAVELMQECAGPHQERARVVWHERFESSRKRPHALQAPDIGGWLELPTFFTELRQRPELREQLWPEPAYDDFRASFRERELRRQLLASAARLGHAFIDLYVMTIQRLGSLDLRAQETADDEALDLNAGRISEYLSLLDRQRLSPRSGRDWSAFDELADIAAHFHLILDVNAHDAHAQPLARTVRDFGQLLGQQRPVGGMSGQVNHTLVRQFRMPGYPLVLISTDLLQEGEDLHTFCSSIHHYGISWTASSMEQRIGRIDRVRSQTDRRLSKVQSSPVGEELLQVYYPYLSDTVEILQVQRVLERMNTFLRLMHAGLHQTGPEDRRIDTGKEFARGQGVVAPIRDRLQSAFPVQRTLLEGTIQQLAVGREVGDGAEARLAALRDPRLPGLDIRWEPITQRGTLMGTARLEPRQQPFRLMLQARSGRLVLRCISPVGRVGPESMEVQDAIVDTARKRSVRVAAIPTVDANTYDLTVESDVLLGADSSCDATRAALLVARVVRNADILEDIHLLGRDEILETFREDLEQEGRGRDER